MSAHLNEVDTEELKDLLGGASTILYGKQALFLEVVSEEIIIIYNRDDCENQSLKESIVWLVRRVLSNNDPSDVDVQHITEYMTQIITLAIKYYANDWNVDY